MGPEAGSKVAVRRDVPGPGSERIHGFFRINGFSENLLINGVYWGVITHVS